MKKLIPLTFILACAIFLPRAVAFAETTHVSVHQLHTEENTADYHFAPFAETYSGSGTMTITDMGTDGTAEVIVSSGPGHAPQVKVLREDGSTITEFMPYAEGYRSGVTVTACDLTGNGVKEIITGTMIGGGPHVRIFTPDGTPLFNGGFFAYGESFRGGVNVACGDIDGDGTHEIITGAGVTGGPHIRVFTPDGQLKQEIFAGSAHDGTGVSVAVGDITGNGKDDIVGARMGNGASSVMVFQEQEQRLSYLFEFEAFADYKGGLNVITADIDNNGRAEIGVATRRHDPGLLTFFNVTGGVAATYSFPQEGTKELYPAVNTYRNNELYALTSMKAPIDYADKYILINVAEQRLYAYEHGVLINTFLTSTGTFQAPTPIGKFAVTDKLLWHDYQWSYGPNHPSNYFLPDVKYNLRFLPHYYIHSAYWHNNFGNRMSRGCVNMRLEDAEWIYNWAQVGTPVEVVRG